MTAILVIVVLLAITGSVMMVSITEGRAVSELTNLRTAFYLAEGGLEAAKWEIVESQDPDGNGVGNKSVSTTAGTYEVTATDLGGGTYQLDSTGVAGGVDASVQQVIGIVETTRFPYGAMSFIGETDKDKVKIKKGADVVLAGGDSPAFLATDKSLYDKFVEEFIEAIVKGVMPAANLSGYPMNSLASSSSKTKSLSSSTIELPILYQPDYADELENLDNLFNDLVNQTEALTKTATQVTDSELSKLRKKSTTITYGAASAPVTIYMTEAVHLEGGDTLTGYGNLVIFDKLELKKGSKLNWNGNIIVTGNTKTSGDLKVEESSVSVDGNLVILNTGSNDSKFYLKKEGSVAVDGSVMVLSDYGDASAKSTKAKLDIDGSFTVNGLVTLLGGRVEVKFKGNSDVGITGMIQAGSPVGSKKEKATLEFDGAVEIYKDDDGIRDGIEALTDLGVALKLTQLESILTETVVVYSWRQVES